MHCCELQGPSWLPAHQFWSNTLFQLIYFNPDLETNSIFIQSWYLSLLQTQSIWSPRYEAERTSPLFLVALSQGWMIYRGVIMYWLSPLCPIQWLPRTSLLTLQVHSCTAAKYSLSLTISIDVHAGLLGEDCGPSKSIFIIWRSTKYHM